MNNSTLRLYSMIALAMSLPVTNCQSAMNRKCNALIYMIECKQSNGYLLIADKLRPNSTLFLKH